MCITKSDKVSNLILFSLLTWTAHNIALQMGPFVSLQEIFGSKFTSWYFK